MPDKVVEKINNDTIAVTQPKKKEHNLSVYKLEYLSIESRIARLLQKYNADLKDLKDRKKFLEQCFTDGMSVGVDVGVSVQP